MKISFKRLMIIFFILFALLPLPMLWANYAPGIYKEDLVIGRSQTITGYETGFKIVFYEVLVFIFLGLIYFFYYAEQNQSKPGGKKK